MIFNKTNLTIDGENVRIRGIQYLMSVISLMIVMSLLSVILDDVLNDCDTLMFMMSLMVTALSTMTVMSQNFS